MTSLTSINIRVTHDCNLKCRHCGVGAPKKENLTIEDVKKIIKEGLELGVKKVSITGGEPLLREDLLEILKICSSVEKVSLSTNATLLTKEKIEETNPLVSSYKISLDGTRNFHNWLRRDSSAFQRTVNSIKMIVNSGKEVNLQMVLTSKNLNDAEKVVDLSEELGAKSICFVPISPLGSAKGTDLILTAQDYKKFLEDNLEKYKNRKILVLFNHTFGLKNTGYACSALKKSVEIKANGKVIPCSFYDFELGDVKKQSLREILKSEKSKYFLKELGGIVEKEPCKGCKFKNTCRGGCTANYYNFSGSFGRDIYCWVNG